MKQTILLQNKWYVCTYVYVVRTIYIYIICIFNLIIFLLFINNYLLFLYCFCSFEKKKKFNKIYATAYDD